MRICALLLTVAVVVWAQTPPPQSKSVIGELTSVDASARRLVIKADNGSTYAIELDEATKFLRVPPGEKDLRKATAIQLKELSAGDRVLARGAVSEETKTVPAKIVIVMTKTDLARKHEEERLAWQRGVVGTVTALNPATKEITVTPRGPNSKPVIVDASNNPAFLRYAPGSYQFSEAKPSAFDAIQVGDMLRARGEKNEDGSRLKAEQVLSGAFQTIAATVVSVDAANGIVRATDLQTKKPVEIHTAAGTLVRRIPEMMATMMARRLQGLAGPPGPAGFTGGPGRRSPATAGGGEGSDGRPAGSAHPGGRGSFDLQQALEGMPALPLTELKKGDAVIVSSTKGGTALTAIILVAGVEPFLAAAPRSKTGQVNLGSWSFDGGIPIE
jgi:hypothetical protein